MQERAWCALQCHQISPSLFLSFFFFFCSISLFLPISSVLLWCHFISSLLLSPLLPTFPPSLFLPACALSYCFPISWRASHFLSPFLPSSFPLLVFFSSVRPSHLFALVSSLLHCQELLYTEQRVITFVLHRVSLIGFVPPSSATSAEKEIEAFFVMFKLYQWGGKVSMASMWM